MCANAVYCEHLLLNLAEKAEYFISWMVAAFSYKKVSVLLNLPKSEIILIKLLQLKCIAMTSMLKKRL